MRVLNKRARAHIGEAKHADTTVKPMRTGRAPATLAVAVLALLAVAISRLDAARVARTALGEALDSTQYRAFTAVSQEFGADARTGRCSWSPSSLRRSTRTTCSPSRRISPAS